MNGQDVIVVDVAVEQFARFFFFFNDPPPTDIYPLPLPAPLPISFARARGGPPPPDPRRPPLPASPWDMSWLDRLKNASYRAVFDANDVADGFALDLAAMFL